MNKFDTTLFINFVNRANKGICLGALIPVLLILFGCGTKSDPSITQEDLLTAKQDDKTVSEKGHRIASIVEFNHYDTSTVQHSISADYISIAPRGFAAFSLNSVNELLLENIHIEIFPSIEGFGETSNNSNRKVDFYDTLRQFVEALPDEYGHVTRVNAQDVRITLHKAGKNGSDIRVHAKKLLKEFADSSHPDLYDVIFYEGDSLIGLHIWQASWDTRVNKFEVKAL